MNMIKKIIKKIRGEQDIEKLKKLGLCVGEGFKYGGGKIDSSFCWLIDIGNNVTLTENTMILAHDASTKKHLGYTKIGRVSIGDNTFVGIGSIVLPNVKIGKNCVIGAGSVVTKDVPDNSVYAGNPAEFIKKTDKYLEEQREKMKENTCFSKEYTIQENISDNKKIEMKEKLKNGKIGYII